MKSNTKAGCTNQRALCLAWGQVLWMWVLHPLPLLFVSSRSLHCIISCFWSCTGLHVGLCFLSDVRETHTELNNCPRDWGPIELCMLRKTALLLEIPSCTAKLTRGVGDTELSPPSPSTLAVVKIPAKYYGLDPGEQNVPGNRGVQGAEGTGCNCIYPNSAGSSPQGWRKRRFHPDRQFLLLPIVLWCV